MGSFYRSQHELALVFKKGKSAYVNNVQLGRFGRNRSNLWQYGGVNTLDPARRQDLAPHPTVKPVGLVADALCDASNRGDVVLDPFCGSGTTLLAAEKVGRRAFCLEIDPLYADVALRRWRAITSESAVHAASGLTFDQLRDARDRQESPVSETPDISPQSHSR